MTSSSEHPCSESRTTQLPRLYPILDRVFVAPPDASGSQRLDAIAALTRTWAAAGVRLLQYRNKTGDDIEILADAREIVRVLHVIKLREQTTLIMNDRVDLCVAAEFDGVHLGQDDLSPEGARRIVGPDFMIGISCHNEEQIRAADRVDAAYLAIGPIFGTTSKADPDPVVGLERLRRIRQLTSKPLVAIGGITRQNCRSVLDAGADCVAVISDLYVESSKSIADFLRILG